LCNIEMTNRIAADAYDIGSILCHLPRDRLEELALPIACHASNAEDLASSHAQPDVLERDRERSGRLARQPAHAKQWFALYRRRWRTRGGDDVGADHHARKRGRSLFTRIAMADDLAVTQHCRAVTEPFHFLEAVG